MAVIDPRSVVDPASRVPYGDAVLEHVPDAPFRVLTDWYSDAVTDPKTAEPGAMTLSTIGLDGYPSSRAVLLKSMAPNGLIFFTSVNSVKAAEIANNQRVGLLLLWPQLFRQVRFKGVAEPVSAEVCDHYFQSRPRGSQISAWASRQSAEVSSRAEVEQAFAAALKEHDSEATIARPPWWGGYLIRIAEVELWLGHSTRLHDRVRYRTVDGDPADLDAAQCWQHTRLMP